MAWTDGQVSSTVSVGGVETEHGGQVNVAVVVEQDGLGRDVDEGADGLGGGNVEREVYFVRAVAGCDDVHGSAHLARGDQGAGAEWLLPPVPPMELFRSDGGADRTQAHGGPRIGANAPQGAGVGRRGVSGASRIANGSARHAASRMRRRTGARSHEDRKPLLRRLGLSSAA